MKPVEQPYFLRVTDLSHTRCSFFLVSIVVVLLPFLWMSKQNRKRGFKDCKLLRCLYSKQGETVTEDQRGSQVKNRNPVSTATPERRLIRGALI